MRTTLLKSSGVGLLLAVPSLLLAAPPTQYEVQKLLAGDAPTRDAFSASVAVSGDTAVIGAPADSEIDGSSGAAYVYTRDSSGGWSMEAKLLASDGSEGDAFGSSVAVSGDSVVVGATFADGNVANSGTAYVFTRDASGVWSEQAKLVASDGARNDDFGWSVAVSGDAAIVGAYLDDDNGVNSGSSYVYSRDASGVWTEQAKLLASDGEAGDYFGLSVAISGHTAVVGAPNASGRRGSVYVYARDPGGLWSEQSKLVASDGAIEDTFGSPVAISGDSVAVSANRDDDNGTDSGSVYLFGRDASGVWTEQAKLLASDGSESDVFGVSLAIDGDAVVAGAFFDDDNGEDSGSAYVFTRDAGGVWTEQVKLLASDGASGDLFGNAVAVSGDTAVVGTYYNYYDRRESGTAYVFDLAAAHDAIALHCPGDITGDGVAELVLVSGSDVRVKELNGTDINRFELAAITGALDTELLPDTNGNGAPELVALGGSPATADVRDLLTGGDLGSVTFDADLAPFDLELMADRTGNGIPELAVLAEDPMRVGVRDGLTGTAVNDVRFTRHSLGKDLLIYPDQNGNGAPELAVLADKRKPQWSDKIEIRDGSTGDIVREIWLGWDWRVLEQELMADQNGNGSAEVAVLRVHPDGSVNVQIRDTVTRERMSYVGFAVKYPPQELVTIPDLDGNGADELVVFGRRFDGSDQKAVIKDSRTGRKLGELRFDSAFPGQDFVDCGDLNGNGAHDLALVGQRPSDGQLQVVVMDSRTGERLALVQF